MSARADAAAATPEGREMPDTATLIGFLAMILATFLSVVDIQIVASSVAAMSASLEATLEEVAWVQSAYITAEIVVIPIAAWLMACFSTRWLVVGCMIGFVLSSIGCALAWDLPSMVTFRAIQGLFAGPLIPIMMSTVFLIFPPGRQTGALALVGFVLMFPAIIGPILGGWITENYSWHWLFLINVPLGLIAIVLVSMFIRFDTPDLRRLRQIDVPGIIIIALFLASAEFVLKEGTKKDWFESDLITYAFWIALISFGLMIWRELTARHPVVDLRLFRRGHFSLGCALSFLTGFIHFGPVFLLPAVLSSIRGFNALQIGNVMLVMGIFAAISGFLASRLEGRLDVRLMGLLGFSMVALGLWVDSDLTNQVGREQLFLGMALRGGGMMLMFLPCSAIALGQMPPHKTTDASGLYNLMRNLGGAVSLSLVTWLMQTRQALHYERLSEAMAEGRIAYDTLSGVPAPQMNLDEVLRDQVNTQEALVEMAHMFASREALVMTYGDIFLVLSLTVGAALMLLPFAKNIRHGGVSGSH